MICSLFNTIDLHCEGFVDFHDLHLECHVDIFVAVCDGA